MNERIKELVRQAVESVDIVTGNESLDDELAKMYIPDCFSEKFAELIVKECAKVILAKAADYPDTDEWHDWTNCMDQAQADIVVHFGVEE